MNKVIENIYKRRGIRKFKDQEVPIELLEELLKCAMAAPSACNKQPWFYYAITNQEMMEKAKKFSRYTNYNAKAAIVVCGDTSKSLSKNDNDFWIQDCSASIENILLAATSLDLGTVWCGLYPMDSAVKRTKEALEIEDNLIPLGLILIGYPDEEKISKTQYSEKNIKWIK